MRSSLRNLPDIGSFSGATRNEGLGLNSTCCAPNSRPARTWHGAPTSPEARKRFSDSSRRRAAIVKSTDFSEKWPALPLEAWKETRDTLHMWTQIVGKIRLKLAPHLNHWWQVPLYL